MQVNNMNYFIMPEIRQLQDMGKITDLVNDRDIMEMIISAVSEYLNVHTVYILKRSRKTEHVYFRQLCMYFVTKNTKITLRDIGERFGGKDHTSVIHSKKKILDFIHIKDEKVLQDIRNIKQLYATLYSKTSHNKLY